jgi:hypothetical protein
VVHTHRLLKEMPAEFNAAFPHRLTRPVILVTEDDNTGEVPVAMIIAIITVLDEDDISRLGLPEEVEIEHGFDLLEVHFNSEGGIILASSCMKFRALEQGLLYPADGEFEETTTYVELEIADPMPAEFTAAVEQGDVVLAESYDVGERAWADLQAHHKRRAEHEGVLIPTAFLVVGLGILFTGFTALYNVVNG